MVLVVDSPCPSATTWLSAKAMPPFCEQLPLWMCEMWEEFGCRPLMATWSVIVSAVAVRVIVPDALVPIPLIVKVNALADACGDGLGEALLGDGDAAPVPPDSPHAVART